ncbi:MAG: VTT domain-containing protein [Acidobacteriaceae bacterium]
MTLHLAPHAAATAVLTLSAAAPAAQAAHHAAHHGALHFFAHLGLVGLFLVAIVNSTFVPLPIPGIADILVIIYAAAHTNPILLVAIATLGSAIGGFVSHAAGAAGGMAFLKKHVSERTLGRITSWMERHPIISVALPAILPPPMPLWPFILAAGAVHMSRKEFMWSFTISRFLRHVIAVWLGIRYGHDVLRMWAHFNDRWANTILIAVWVIIGLSLAFAVYKLYTASREFRSKPETTPTH